MPDLSKYSDEQLRAIANGDSGVRGKSDAELFAIMGGNTQQRIQGPMSLAPSHQQEAIPTDGPLQIGYPLIDQAKMAISKIAQLAKPVLDAGDEEVRRKPYFANTPLGIVERLWQQGVATGRFVMSLPEFVDQLANPEKFGTTTGKVASDVLPSMANRISNIGRYAGEFMHDVAQDLTFGQVSEDQPNPVRGALNRVSDVLQAPLIVGGQTPNELQAMAAQEYAENPGVLAESALMAEAPFSNLKGLRVKPFDAAIDVKGTAPVSAGKMAEAQIAENLEQRPQLEYKPLPGEKTGIPMTKAEYDLAQTVRGFQEGEITFDQLAAKVAPSELVRLQEGKLTELQFMAHIRSRLSEFTELQSVLDDINRQIVGQRPVGDRIITDKAGSPALAEASFLRRVLEDAPEYKVRPAEESAKVFEEAFAAAERINQSPAARDMLSEYFRALEDKPVAGETRVERTTKSAPESAEFLESALNEVDAQNMSPQGKTLLRQYYEAISDQTNKPRLYNDQVQVTKGAKSSGLEMLDQIRGAEQVNQSPVGAEGLRKQLAAEEFKSTPDRIPFDVRNLSKYSIPMLAGGTIAGGALYDYLNPNDSNEGMALAGLGMLGGISMRGAAKGKGPKAAPVEIGLNAVPLRRKYDVVGLYHDVTRPAFFELERLGDKALNTFWHPVNDAIHRGRVASEDVLTNLKKTLKANGVGPIAQFNLSERVMLHAIAQQEGGAAILAKAGKEAPKLTKQELAVYEHMRSNLEQLYVGLNDARVRAGKEPIGYVDNYFTWAHELNDLAEAGHGLLSDEMARSSTRKVATEKAFGSTKHRGDEAIKVELDAIGVYGRYVENATQYIATTPEIAKINKLLVDSDLAKTNPGAYKAVSNWINFVANGSVPLRYGDSLVRALIGNVSRSSLSFLGSVMAVQPTAYLNTVTYLGPRWAAEGVRIVNPKWDRFAIKESKVLKGREMDVGIPGKSNTKAGMAKAAVDLIGEGGMYFTKQLDMTSAVATWLAAYNKARNYRKMKYNHADAVKFADETVIRTQGDASRHNVAPLQRSTAGRMWTQFQTFVTFNINFLERDVFGHNNPKLPMAERVKRVTTYLLGVQTLNTVWQQMGLPSPFPDPVGAMMENKEKGKTGLAAAGNVAKEALKPFPLVGGALRYSGNWAPPVVDAAGKAGYELFRGNIGEGAAEASRLVGVPGVTQAKKLIKDDEDEKSKRGKRKKRSSRE